jgi:hypothetical protein
MTWNGVLTSAIRTMAVLVTVTVGAAVGPVRARADDLSGYERQRLSWHTCQRGSADQAGAELDQAGVKMGSYMAFRGECDQGYSSVAISFRLAD